MNWALFAGIAAFVVFDMALLFYLFRKSNRPGGLSGRSGPGFPENRRDFDFDE